MRRLNCRSAGRKIMWPRRTSQPPPAPSTSSLPLSTRRSLCSGSPSEPSCQLPGLDPRRAPGRVRAEAPGALGPGHEGPRGPAQARGGAVPPARLAGRAPVPPTPSTPSPRSRVPPRPLRGRSAKVLQDLFRLASMAPADSRPQELRQGRKVFVGHRRLASECGSRRRASRSGAARDDQALRRHARRRRRRPRPAPRRDPGAARRERRRQVDPDQDAGRRPCARRRADGARRRALSIRAARAQRRSPSSIRISA